MYEHSTIEVRKPATTLMAPTHSHSERAFLLQVLHHLMDWEYHFANVYLFFVFEFVWTGNHGPAQEQFYHAMSSLKPCVTLEWTLAHLAST